MYLHTIISSLTQSPYLTIHEKVGVAIITGTKVTLSINIACICALLTHDGYESTLDSWPFLRWTGPNRKVGSTYLHRPCTNEYHCRKEKAGSLHSEQPRGTDCFCSAWSQWGWAWKGALFAQGEAWMPWLGCRGWHVVLLELSWHAVLLTAGPLALSFQPQISHESLGAMGSSKPDLNLNP